MDLSNPILLSNILSSDDLEKTPIQVQQKLTSCLANFFDEYCKEKAAANRLYDYEQKTEELQAQIQDYEAKIQNYSQNVADLRSQLDVVSKERIQLLESTTLHEKELASLRIEKNSLVEERDSLLNRIERQSIELERLQDEVRTYQQQLNNAIAAKCKAITRADEIASKEMSLEFKERHMEQEHNMLHIRIQTLSEELNRSVSELHTIRQENTMQCMHLEARLSEKIEELKIAQSQCHQYKENIDQLNQDHQELSRKALSQSEEASKLIDHFKKELEAKTKLADLYKRNSEDSVVERNELATAITDLKRLLSEASDMYGDLETKYKATIIKHEKELEEKDKIIESQKAELNNANDLLKEVQHESVEAAISKLAPSAAVSSRLIRSDMSLTELYSLYVKTSEELELHKRENSRLNTQMKSIVQELSDTAPNIKKQELEYERVLEINHILETQRDELINKKAEIEELLNVANAKVNHLERENKKLKRSQSDLSRQVCYLLKEIEELRAGYSSNRSQQSCNMSTTDDVISSKLVTFKNITDLQENNQRLLLVVRDLSTKLENAEIINQKVAESAFKEKIESYEKRFDTVQETLNKQNNTVATLVAKCERYKKMYFDLQKSINKSVDDEMSENEDVVMDNTQNISTNVTQTSDRRLRDLETQLQEAKDNYKSLKEQYEYYVQEKKNNDKVLNEQFDSMRKEVRELSSTNCKLMSSLEYSKEQIKLQQKNIASYKKEISVLEERNKNYETTVAKHEQTVIYLKDEVLKTQRGFSALESEVNHLRQENRILRDTNARLNSEKETYYRENQNQNLLLNNIELIKSNLERSEMEGRSRLEQRLDETVRELSAQRRRFQEEEDRFRETINDVKRQAASAKTQMEEEKAQADKLRQEVQTLREQLTSKTNEIDHLSRRLQESLTPSKNDNPIAQANKKIREYEIKLDEAKIEITSLQADLSKAKEHVDQYYKMSQSAETEIKKLHELHVNYVAKAESEINHYKEVEENLKLNIAELQTEVQLTNVAEISTQQQPEQLQKLQTELKDALCKLSECNRNLRSLRADNSALSESLSAVQTKYANEMAMHSVDIQELTKVKDQLSHVQDQLNEFVCKRDSTAAAFEELKQSNKESLELFEKEKQSLEERIKDLNSLNANLHDQIEALTAKFSVLSQTQIGSHNVSTDDSVMDVSNTEPTGDSKNVEQLLQIIKFLRKEKDLTIAKLDIIKAENTRLKSEQVILQKKIDELKGLLNQERTKSESVLISATKHEEILRKIETLNAITDSNRILREERNSLADRVKELNERISGIEGELFPLQNQNRELSMKVDELNTENSSLRTEAIKWRQRANILVEKSNKNPEEFKRLQMERESLAKMLTSEKELLVKTNEELNSIKLEKIKIESDLVSLEKQLQSINEEKKKLIDDINAIKHNNSRILQEIMELKNKLLQKEETIQKISEELEAKDAQLQDSKNKEVQIRKIAKRYKDSYLELSNKTNTTSSDGAATSAPDNLELNANNGGESSNVVISHSELDQQRAKIENLNSVNRIIQEENEKLRKENDELKASAEIDERTKSLLRDAKTRIVNLTETKNAMSQELIATKTKLQNLMQSTENHDATINEIKNHYEETFARMEKDILDQNNLKESIARLARENDALQMRINQLNRQLGLQQTAKPSTSSVAMNEKSCISESSPRTANVKPMSGSTNVQQSATVTPWRGSETPLASIRPISVQNSRTAAILPTSQQTVGGGSSTSSSTGSSNTALVPPQQQVHTTGSSSVESMSSSPTSSHTDYMPSTSSAAVAVAAIPPMGSAAAAESSQEAESIQQTQQNDQQLILSGSQQQAVALVSPRVEGSSQNAPSPNLQMQQDPNNQQPSTSGASSATIHIAVSSQSRHAASCSSNVTTTQAGSSGAHKRSRETEGDSSTNNEESSSDTTNKHSKRIRGPMHTGDDVVVTGVTGCMDVEYQVPTSSQRDQEDDIVIVDSDDDEEDEITEADDGPIDGEADPEAYEDSYEQDQDIDENDCPEINEGNNQLDAEVDNNEVDVDECMENQAQCLSDSNNPENAEDYLNKASTSRAASPLLSNNQQQNNQQNEAISSGSYEPSNMPWKQVSSIFARQQKTTMMSENEQDASGVRHSDSSVSSPQGSKFGYTEQGEANKASSDFKADDKDAAESIGESVNFMNEGYKDDEEALASGKGGSGDTSVNIKDSNEVNEEFLEDAATTNDNENVDTQDQSKATQSEIEDIQQSQIEGNSEEHEAADTVSSEGEKQSVEEAEEEGREAVATTSPSVNTRSKSVRGGSGPIRKTNRGFLRNVRPTPIIWQESPGNSRNPSPNQRNQEMAMNAARGFPNQRSQRARRMRRPSGNYGNMRYS